MLVVRLSAIGDVVMAGLVAQAVKRRWPQSRVTWLAEPPGAAVARANPWVDQVLVWDKAAWRSHWRAREIRALLGAARDLRRALRRGRFDLVLDLQGLLKSAVPAFLTGAPVRIGLGPREGGRLLMTAGLPRRGHSRRIGSEYWALAEAIGAPLPREEFAVPLYSAEDRAAAAATLAERGVDGPYVVFCPFTTRPQKHWVRGRWAELGEALYRAHGLPVVVLGGPGDREEAAAIAAGSPALVPLAGDTTLGQGAAVIDGAALVVGVDTGLTHMAMLSSPPTFAIFGSTRPYQELMKDSDRLFFRDLPCAPCRRRPTCGGRFDCMQGVGVAEVAAAAGEVLGRAPGAATRDGTAP